MSPCKLSLFHEFEDKATRQSSLLAAKVVDVTGSFTETEFIHVGLENRIKAKCFTFFIANSPFTEI